MTVSPHPGFSAHGATIPAVGFGTSPMTGGLIGRRSCWPRSRPATATSTPPANTAPSAAVGEAMRASGVPRADIFLTTKVSHEYLRADDFARSVDQSLAALKVDYVDLLMVHWPNPAIALSETMPALAKAKRQGLARHIGVANFNIGAARRGDRALPGAAGGAAGGVSPLSRPDQAAQCRA